MDTSVFGFPVAKIVPDKLTVEDLKTILTTQKKQNISLVYWASDSTHEESQRAAELFGGFLADRKTTHVINLKKIPQEDLVIHANIEEYDKDVPERELENLAVLAGSYSRFKADPRITQKQYEGIYKLWMLNSVNRTIADSVFVVRDKKEIVGMITVGEKNGRGNIGLLAVNADIKRMNIGTALVRAAQSWFLSRGYEIGQVVTQRHNIPACRLFEKCGFQVEKVENFYHFWL